MINRNLMYIVVIVAAISSAIIFQARVTASSELEVSQNPATVKDPKRDQPQLLDAGLSDHEPAAYDAYSICSSAVLWQIGYFDKLSDPPSTGGDEFEHGSAYFDVYDYDVDANPDDEIHSPNFPGFLYDQPSGVTVWTARQINITFNLETPHRNMVFVLTRYGSETNDILLDSTWITSTVGVSNGVKQSFEVALGSLAEGSHTLTIEYLGGGDDDGNFLDAMSLQGTKFPASLGTYWQIGRFEGALDPELGEDEFGSGNTYFETFDYRVDTDPDDQLSSPSFPGFVFDAPTNKPIWTARNINIAFRLPATVQSEMLFTYSRYGSETVDVLLDGNWIASTMGLEERLHHTYWANLGVLPARVHILTLTYAGGGSDNGSSIDAVGLCIDRE